MWGCRGGGGERGHLRMVWPASAGGEIEGL